MAKGSRMPPGGGTPRGQHSGISLAKHWGRLKCGVLARMSVSADSICGA
jgi:hypothetical protein